MKNQNTIPEVRKVIIGRFIPSTLSYPRSVNSPSGGVIIVLLFSSNIFHCCPDLAVIYSTNIQFYLFTAQSKLKEYADKSSNITIYKTFLQKRIENIFGKRENTNHQHLSLFQQCFQKLSSLGFCGNGLRDIEGQCMICSPKI